MQATRKLREAVSNIPSLPPRPPAGNSWKSCCFTSNPKARAAGTVTVADGPLKRPSSFAPRWGLGLRHRRHCESATEILSRVLWTGQRDRATLRALSSPSVGARSSRPLAPTSHTIVRVAVRDPHPFVRRNRTVAHVDSIRIAGPQLHPVGGPAALLIDEINTDWDRGPR